MILDTKHFSFYNEIKFAFCDAKCSKDFWTTPLGMKKFLKIEDFEQIKKFHIPLIEDKIKVSISVIGDYEYESQNKYPRRISLQYKNDLYTLKVKKQSIQKIYPKNLTLTTFFQIDDHYLTYDGNEIIADYTMTAQQLKTSKNIIYKKFQKSELTENEIKIITDITDKDELEEQIAKYLMRQHDEYINNINHLKQISGIDISENGFSIKQTALNLLSNYLKPYQFSNLDKKETEFYFNTKCHGLMYCSEPTTIKGKLIDANSFYPSIMTSNKFIVPLGNPMYSKMDKIPDVIPFGIYRAKITNYDRRLFAGNDKHYYTYTDIKQAVKRGYTIEVIQDGEDNFMGYDSSNRESADKLFKQYVDILYPHKKSNPLVKRLLNILWGTLSQKKKFYADDTELDLDDDDDIVDIGENGIESFLIKKHEYVHNHARIGVFLTAYGRSKMADYMEDFINEIYRIHTDGFYTTSNKDFHFSTELGGFKLEDEGRFKINNLNNIEKIE